MESLIRPFEKQDTPFLWEMLYQAIYVAEGEQPLNRDVLNEPSIEKYLKDWGRADDHARIAVDGSHKPIGAIWIRRFHRDDAGYGFVDEETPELSMAILPEYRGRGIGRKLLTEMADTARSLGYRALSLSVAAHNIPALRLYEKCGYTKVGEDDGSSWIMKKVLIVDSCS